MLAALTMFLTLAAPPPAADALVLAACKRERLWPPPAAIREAVRLGSGRGGSPRGGFGGDASAATLRLCRNALLAPAVDASVSEEEARQHYTVHRARFVVPARLAGRLWEVRVEEAGEPSSRRAAGELLQRAAKAQAGGDSPTAAARIRTRPVSEGDPAWGASLARLRPGETSDLIWNGDTVALVLRIADHPARDRPWDEVRPAVESAVRQERRSLAWQALLTRLRAEAAGPGR